MEAHLEEWVPNHMRFFTWLVYQDLCWTANPLARHGLPRTPRCPLCDQQLETMLHLLIDWVSRKVWHEVLAWRRSTSTALMVSTCPINRWQSMCSVSTPTRSGGVASLIMLSVWLTSNTCSFEGEGPRVYNWKRTSRQKHFFARYPGQQGSVPYCHTSLLSSKRVFRV